MRRKSWFVVALAVLACTCLLGSQEAVSSGSDLGAIDERVSAPMPALYTECFARCKFVGGSYTCNPYPIEDLCILQSSTECSNAPYCNFCEFPCN